MAHVYEEADIIMFDNKFFDRKAIRESESYNILKNIIHMKYQ